MGLLKTFDDPGTLNLVFLTPPKINAPVRFSVNGVRLRLLARRLPAGRFATQACTCAARFFLPSKSGVDAFRCFVVPVCWEVLQ
jgi:hypothetical protein